MYYCSGVVRKHTVVLVARMPYGCVDRRVNLLACADDGYRNGKYCADRTAYNLELELYIII